MDLIDIIVNYCDIIDDIISCEAFTFQGSMSSTDMADD